MWYSNFFPALLGFLFVASASPIQQQDEEKRGICPFVTPADAARLITSLRLQQLCVGFLNAAVPTQTVVYTSTSTSTSTSIITSTATSTIQPVTTQVVYTATQTVSTTYSTSPASTTTTTFTSIATSTSTSLVLFCPTTILPPPKRDVAPRWGMPNPGFPIGWLFCGQNIVVQGCEIALNRPVQLTATTTRTVPARTTATSAVFATSVVTKTVGQATVISNQVTTATVSIVAPGPTTTSTVVFNTYTVTTTTSTITAAYTPLITPAPTFTFLPLGVVQCFTVEEDHTAQIQAAGGQGGNGAQPGGQGASVGGTYSLTSGTVYYVVVGSQGTADPVAGSGGGGSFVFDQNENLMLVGGAGGAGGSTQAGQSAVTCAGSVGGGAPEGGTSEQDGNSGAGWMGPGQSACESSYTNAQGYPSFAGGTCTGSLPGAFGGGGASNSYSGIGGGGGGAFGGGIYVNYEALAGDSYDPAGCNIVGNAGNGFVTVALQ